MHYICKKVYIHKKLSCLGGVTDETLHIPIVLCGWWWATSPCIPRDYIANTYVSFVLLLVLFFFHSSLRL